MRSFSKLGIILSCIFGVILLGLVAELFYFLWWKKRLNRIQIEGHQHTEHNFPTKLFNFLFCWKKPNSVSNLDVNFRAEETNNVHKQEEEEEEEEEDVELGNSRETLLKGGLVVEESVEAELIRLHNLCGPPRFLFTIKEETKEELESENATNGKGSRTRKSLNDLIIGVENKSPLTTPFPSPPIKIASLEAFDHHGFNPLFESLTEADFIKLTSSPPPKFKFLRDAEEKLFKKLALRKGDSFQDSSEAPIQNSGLSAKVIPLVTTSPSTLRPLGLKKSNKK